MKVSEFIGVIRLQDCIVSVVDASRGKEIAKHLAKDYALMECNSGIMSLDTDAVSMNPRDMTIEIYVNLYKKS